MPSCSDTDIDASFLFINFLVDFQLQMSAIPGVFAVQQGIPVLNKLIINVNARVGLRS